MSTNEKKYILIVDDSVTVRNIIAKQLGDEYIIFHADNGDEAWRILQSNDAVSLVFLDLLMPVMNGMILLKQIRESDNKHIAKLPVIMITGHKDSDAARMATRKLGATDFIRKPFTAADIIRSAKTYAHCCQRELPQKENPAQDNLTGLLNSKGFQERGEKVFYTSMQRNVEISILLMQIKAMNKLKAGYGQEITDQIILSITKNIKNTLRGDDIMAHLGSGQFAVLLSDTNAFKAHIIAMRIQNAVKRLLFKFNERTIDIQIAVGLNASENYSSNQTFHELCVQTEQALHASLQHKECKIIRRAELFPEVPYYDVASNQSSKFQEMKKADTPASASVATASINNTSTVAAINTATSTTAANTAATNNENYDVEKLCSYLPAIMKGEFEKIPAEYIERMITPLQSCLDYAYKHLQIKADKVPTVKN